MAQAATAAGVPEWPLVGDVKSISASGNVIAIGATGTETPKIWNVRSEGGVYRFIKVDTKYSDLESRMNSTGWKHVCVLSDTSIAWTETSDEAAHLANWSSKTMRRDIRGVTSHRLCKISDTHLATLTTHPDEVKSFEHPGVVRRITDTLFLTLFPETVKYNLERRELLSGIGEHDGQRLFNLFHKSYDVTSTHAAVVWVGPSIVKGITYSYCLAFYSLSVAAPYGPRGNFIWSDFLVGVSKLDKVLITSSMVLTAEGDMVVARNRADGVVVRRRRFSLDVCDIAALSDSTLIVTTSPDNFTYKVTGYNDVDPRTEPAIAQLFLPSGKPLQTRQNLIARLSDSSFVYITTDSRLALFSV